ncbi:MAG: OmpA family protein, partial [Kofleriaceae bacterium]|nr:OmpA family protein [Kofleriaceae bacterium]
GCSSTTGTSGTGSLLLLILTAGFLLYRRRKVAATTLGLGVLLFAVGVPGAASAQIDRNIEVERFRLATDSQGVMDVEGAETLDSLQWDVGLLFGNSADPLVVRREQRTQGDMELGSLVSNRFGAELVGAIGIVSNFQLAVALPLSLSQSEDSIPGTPMTGLSTTGIGDLRLSPKYQILTQKTAGISLAIMPVLVLPTASDDGYMGEGRLGFAPEVVVAKRFGSMRIAANFGYRIRENTKLANVEIGDELTFRAGGAYVVNPGGDRPLEVSLTTALATQAASPFGSANQSPLEILAGASYGVSSKVDLFGGAGAGVARGLGTPSWRVLAGLRFHRPADKAALHSDSDNDGIDDADDKCPSEPEDVDGTDDSDGCPDLDDDNDGIADVDDACPKKAETVNGFEDEDGCPDSVPDVDGDGVSDDVDGCPDVAEDVDGFEDEDGCPDLDNDEDGIADSLDDCPNEAEVLNGIADEDGCPDEPVAKVDPSSGFPPPIEFLTGSARLRSSSGAALDRMAAILTKYPVILVLEVQGHTSQEGSAEFNQSLSARRAGAVVDALVKRGVTRSRLRANGYGASQPIDTSESTARRKRNRRVQFHIESRSDK